MNQIRKNTVSAKEQVNNYILYENPYGKGKKILFLGNSITRHAVKESIGWLNDWGMAASAKEKDYVHLIMSAVQEKEPDAAFCICQAATWERAYDNAESVYDMLKPAREFHADVVILRLIENCPLEGFDKTIFREAYLKLIQYLNVNQKAKIILTSSFWKREGDDIIEDVAKENGWDYIYLGDLGERSDMRADGLFKHQGVAHHPGDLGMEMIAKRILEKMGNGLGVVNNTRGLNQTYYDKMKEIFLEEYMEQEPYGARCIARLIMRPDAGEKEINRLNRVAKWFELPHPTKPGRDLQGEPDFVAHKLVRAVYMLENKLPAETKDLINKFFTEWNFESKYKSENHMLLFHSSRYLYALKFPTIKFKQYGMTAEEVIKQDKDFLQEFIRFRAQRGWAEFDSYGYNPEDFTVLLNLFDFGESEMRKYAEMSANLLLMDMIADCSKEGYCGGAHGRIYENTVFDHRKSGLYALYQLYFGEEVADGLYLEPLLSNYRPADYVYDMLNARPDKWENKESKHLHSITYDTPHKQVPQVPGSINKRTYVTPDYMIGGVTWQDDYPEDSEAAWYAHHQQHEWELSILTAPDVRIFTHHPGGFGPEGKEHGYWTGDLFCCCGQFFSDKNVAMATYDIPENESDFIHASIPFNQLETEKEEQYLWMKASDRVYAGLWLSQGIERGGEGLEGIEVRSYGRKHGVVCSVATKEECGSYEEFKAMFKANKPEFDAESMTLTYGNLKMNRKERFIDGKRVEFPYETYDSPMMYSKHGSGIIETDKVILDFNGWGSVIYKK